MNIKTIIGSVFGTTLSAVGTAIQTQEVLQIVSLIITILGAIVSFIVIPLLTFFKNASKDGKIDIEEIEEGAKILEDGINKTKDEIEKEQNKNADQRKD